MMTEMVITLVPITHFSHFDAMISSLAKVMGLQSRQKQGPKTASLQEHTSRHGKVIQHDRSDNVSHTTYYFYVWKSVAPVLGKLVVFLRSTHNGDYASQRRIVIMGRP